MRGALLASACILLLLALAGCTPTDTAVGPSSQPAQATAPPLQAPVAPRPAPAAPPRQLTAEQKRAQQLIAQVEAAYAAGDAAEQRGAERIFALLPEEQGRELRALWEEFEAFKTPESKYANALDRLQPLLHNSRTEGGTWRIHSVARDQVYRRMEPIRTALPELWPVVTRMIADACARGWIVS